MNRCFSLLFAQALLLLTLVFSASCTSEQSPGEPDQASGNGELGTLHLALEAGTDDVVGFRFDVWDPTGAVITSRYVPLEEENFPSHMLPGTGPGHRFADAYFVLAPGFYSIVAQPMLSDREESNDCAPARAEVEVVANHTTEVILVSHCDMEDTGSVDIVVLTNHDPRILNLVYDPSKFILTCEELWVSVEARDPEDDPMTYEWEVIAAPVGAIYEFDPDGSRLHFMSRTAGDYELRVTVCDTVPDPDAMCAWLDFPIHVQISTDNNNNGIGDECDEVTVVWTKEGDFERGDGQNVLYSEETISIDQFQCEDTSYLWVPSTGEDQMILFDTNTLDVLGEYRTCQNPSRIGQDFAGNVFVTCRADGRAMKMDLDGNVLWDTDLSGECGASLRGAVYVPRAGEPNRVYIGCSSQPITFVLDADNGRSLTRVNTNQVYGLATDGRRVYVASIGAPTQGVDVETNEVIWTNEGMLPYGIAASADGMVWISGNTFNGAPTEACLIDGRTGITQGCVRYNAEALGRGVAISPVDGMVWVALSGVNLVAKIDPERMELVGEYRTGGVGPVGVAVDSNNVIYVVHLDSSEIGRLRSDGVLIDTFGEDVLVNPYAYSSDMTGSVVRCLETFGIWTTQQIDMGYLNSHITLVRWVTSEPPNTEVSVEHRLDRGPWVRTANGQPLDETGGVIQFRVTLRSVERGVSPLLDELMFTYRPWDRP